VLHEWLVDFHQRKRAEVFAQGGIAAGCMVREVDLRCRFGVEGKRDIGDRREGFVAKRVREASRFTLQSS
jgi:hypothetical protein